MSAPTVHLDFNSIAASYLKQSAGVTRVVSIHLLDLIPPITSSSVIHDNACGPGVTALDILDRCKRLNITPPPKIHCTDKFDGMVNVLRSVVMEQDLSNIITAEVMDSADLSTIPDTTFTHSITNFGLFLADSAKGAREIYRTLKPGGAAGVTVWKKAGNMELAYKVQKTIKPEAEMEWPVSIDWTKEGYLASVLEEGGFEKSKISVSEKEVLVKLDDVEEFVELLGSTFYEPFRRDMTEEERTTVWNENLRRVVREDGLQFKMVAWVAVAEK
ncbi:S-adenosyl-L-methionine-dependent methyltransferase [Aulographum hederae CBS 113979]|uniref:S-adenosyl-L-methionine-dependent methyltransferase n=1 Tax=Aulographum hederae CBS 113979 TaxID=1176131 RepID=A0A6G1HBF3_9PEZI|nr:S-adenosyl-L-methionine-dependent methyltransferase [Aulographum hederae CBS 113979]